MNIHVILLKFCPFFYLSFIINLTLCIIVIMNKSVIWFTVCVLVCVNFRDDFGWLQFLVSEVYVSHFGGVFWFIYFNLTLVLLVVFVVDIAVWDNLVHDYLINK